MEHNPEFAAYAHEALGLGLTDKGNVVLFPARKNEADYTHREVRLYDYFLHLLLLWAQEGYPRNRLARDLHWQAAR